VYAPHVGVSIEGEVGYYNREGQSSKSTSCGACVGALSFVEGLEANCHVKDSDDDYQMSWIKQIVKEKISPISQHSKGKLVGLCHEVYKAGRAMMLDMMNLSMLNGGSLALLGGLQINMPDPMEDFFLPLDFELYKEGQPTEDLIHFLDEAKLWEMQVQPEIIGKVHVVDETVPRSPTGGDSESGISRSDAAAKDAEIVQLKEQLTKLQYAYEARDDLLKHMVNMIGNNGGQQ